MASMAKMGLALNDSLNLENHRKIHDLSSGLSGHDPDAIWDRVGLSLHMRTCMCRFDSDMACSCTHESILHIDSGLSECFGESLP